MKRAIVNENAIEKVAKIQEPKIPIKRPNKLAERKLKNGNNKIERYIKIIIP